jgi:hypothetical protein
MNMMFGESRIHHERDLARIFAFRYAAVARLLA